MSSICGAATIAYHRLTVTSPPLTPQPHNRFSTISEDTTEDQLKSQRLEVLLYSPKMRASMDALMYGMIESSYIQCQGFDDYLEAQHQLHSGQEMGSAWLKAFRSIDWTAARRRMVVYDR